MTSNPDLRPIPELAKELGIAEADLVPYGSDMAKVRLSARNAALKARGGPGKLVLVSAITPTKSGEGKTTTSIGLAQGLRRIGENVSLALREPSLGPIFGMKGGATGGGASIVVPQDEINLHFTGDFHAITSANNLLAALLDNHLYWGGEPAIDSRRVLWRRVVDLNDRSLRQVIVGLGGRLQGIPRENGFDITPASEIMAVLCLAEDEQDLRARLSRLLVGFTRGGEPVTADELDAVGSMMVLLRDAMMPNLVQSIEGVPAFVHGGPFANIAHGCNSVIATKMSMAHSDWTITEAGFGFDLGAEKFFDIKCQSAGLETAAVILVATIRALKRHGGIKKELEVPNAEAVEKGLPNLLKHIENVQAFGQQPIVAINQFGTDSDEEIAVVAECCEKLDVPYAVSDHFARGGEGAEELARKLVEHASDEPGRLKPLYQSSDSIEDKVHKIASTMYGATGVQFTKTARTALRMIKKLGYGDLAVCMAKTPASLSDDATKTGRPENFEITVRDFQVSAGAGFVVALLGDILRMPGLPRVPQSKHIDLKDGEIVGLR